MQHTVKMTNTAQRATEYITAQFKIDRDNIARLYEFKTMK